MNNIGDLLHWLKANPDMIILIGLCFIGAAAFSSLKTKGKSAWYAIGSIVTLGALGVLVGLLFAANA